MLAFKRIEGLQHIKIGLEKLLQRGCARACEKLPQAKLCLVGFSRFFTVEIVEAHTRMGVHIPKRRVLGGEVHENTRQQCVLEDICKIARVVGMAVIHECSIGWLSIAF